MPLQAAGARHVPRHASYAQRQDASMPAERMARALPGVGENLIAHRRFRRVSKENSGFVRTDQPVPIERAAYPLQK